MKEISAGFVLILFLISAYVAAGLSEKRNMWKWICVYWLALMVKNAVDLIGGLISCI